MILGTISIALGILFLLAKKEIRCAVEETWDVDKTWRYTYRQEVDMNENITWNLEQTIIFLENDLKEEKERMHKWRYRFFNMKRSKENLENKYILKLNNK